MLQCCGNGDDSPGVFDVPWELSVCIQTARNHAKEKQAIWQDHSQSLRWRMNGSYHIMIININQGGRKEGRKEVGLFGIYGDNTIKVKLEVEVEVEVGQWKRVVLCCDSTTMKIESSFASKPFEVERNCTLIIKI